MNDIRNKFIKAIEATDNPTAPMILQEAYGSVDRLGKMFTPIGDQAQVELISARLLKDFPDTEIDKFCAKPNFIIALSILLSQALISYGRSL